MLSDLLFSSTSKISATGEVNEYRGWDYGGIWLKFVERGISYCFIGNLTSFYIGRRILRIG